MVRVKAQRGDHCPDFALDLQQSVISNPPFEVVIHIANPRRFKRTEDAPVDRDRGKRVSAPVTQAISDVFSPGWYWFYWYPGSKQREFPFGQKGCDHLLFCRNPRPK